MLQVDHSAQASLADCPVLMLAGGLGMRLRSVYEEGPKVMAPVNGQPFLRYLLTALAKSGFRHVVLCVGYRSHQIKEWLGDGKQFGLAVSYSHETEAMGTAGALRLAYLRNIIGRRFFAMNGDSILQLDFEAMYRFHNRIGSLATMAVATVSNTSRYGMIDVDSNGNIRSFKEKGGQRTAGYINGGIYLFEPPVMDLVADGRAVSLEREVLPKLVSQRLQAFKTTGYFIDIGVPEDYCEAQVELKELSS